VGANWLLLKRDNPHSSQIIATGAGATVFDASQFDFDWESGFEVFASHQIAPNWAAQLRYLQVDGFDAGASVVLTGVPIPIILHNEVFAGDPANLSYFTRLYSAEANLITTSHFPWLDLIGGLRYVRLEDRQIERPSYGILGL